MKEYTRITDWRRVAPGRLFRRRPPCIAAGLFNFQPSTP
jgi:hypothetical protein